MSNSYEGTGRVEYSAPPAAIKGADFVPLPLRKDVSRRVQATLAGFISILLLFFAAAARGDVSALVKLHGRTMGTTYNIRYWVASGTKVQSPALQREVDALLARFDLMASTWRADSELSRFNLAAAGEWFAVSADTANVVERALELHRITDGASDVTIGPVFQLWGFGAQAAERRNDLSTPSEKELQAALARVGAKHLHVRTDPPALRKAIEGLEVDLSSIAPGYAVDLIAEQLAAAGVDNAMVELGGEVRGVGHRPDGRPWRIGVQRPPPAEKTVGLVVPLANLALATSGDFHNVRTIDGVKVTHIVDPRTGRPLSYRGASVTVVAPTCFEADGLATALFVMGDEAAYQWCVEHDAAAVFQAAGADGAINRRETPAFLKLTNTAVHGTTAE